VKGKEMLRRCREQYKNMGFELEEGKKRCIHEKESRRLMKEVVGAGGWSEKVLEEGLKVEFREIPGRYSEKNNKSAQSKIEAVREKVTEWEQKVMWRR
jgi:acetoin utilization deacetylase AcuC-like enzyme